MVQSDALSQRPDLCPEEDRDNEDIIMLTDNMFLNLINTDLQEKIVMTNDVDGNAADALKLLLEKGPTTMTTGLDDWMVENSNGRNILFYKGKNYIPRILNYNEKLYTPSMIMKLQDTQEKLECTMQCGNTTGGLDSGHL